jgi:pimeloyl-ACP methyl ester carboxylesterase
MLDAGPSLPPALTGERQTFKTSAGALSFYRSLPADSASGLNGTPLLLLHSINAAGSAYEVRPLYDNYSQQRPVYALDFPGFGYSERSDRVYSARLMTDAIHAMVDLIRKEHGGNRIDTLALSLSSEFLARAICERPGDYRSAALISPTGFDKHAPYYDALGTTRAKPWLYRFLRFPLWSRLIFSLLTTRSSIRHFLERTWGSKDINEGLLDYDYKTTHEARARFAPYYFVSGYLFSRDITRIYEQLALPVWLAHGDHGDFQDYEYVFKFKGRPNWTVAEFRTGALPFFELPQEFMRSYELFLSRTTL